MREQLPSGTPVEVVRVGAPAAGLVVVPDIFGLRDLFDDLVARLSAENGWSVAAFEPFPDQSPPSVEERMALMPTMHDERWVAELCGTKRAFLVALWPSPKGGADYKVVEVPPGTDP